MTAQRLSDIAQRLDELSDDLPELSGIAEELGTLADTWPVPKPDQSRYSPVIENLMKHIEHAVEREVQERMYGRRPRYPEYSMHTHATLNPRYLVHIAGAP